MKESDNFDRFLARELKRDQEPVPDEGFTDGVMAALPADNPHRLWRDRLLVALTALVVAIAVLAQWPIWDTAGQLWQWFLMADLTQLLKTGAAVSAATLLASLGWLAREMEWV